MQQVGALLDDFQPARLNPVQQSVEPERGETWVKLRHDSEPWLDIRLALSDGWVNLYGVMGHDEAYSVHSEPKDSWEADTIAILADLLQSDFTIDRWSLRGKLWREVVTIGDPYNRTCTGPSLAAALPLRRWAIHAESHRATFECRGSHPSQT